MTSASAPKTDLEERAVGAYLGLAVGDALGATVEFMTPREIEEHYGSHQTILGGGWLHLRRGQVTDDTEMSLALGRAILEAGGRVDAKTAAEHFSAWMASKPVDIGHTVRRGLADFRRTGTCEMPEHEFDAGNGACMRALPVALATFGVPPEEVRAANRAQAHVTHHNALSDAGTECVIAMVQAALWGGVGSLELPSIAARLVEQHRAFRFDKRRRENPSGFIVETLQAVFQAVFGTNNFEAALIDVVNRGGDADTTGAITGMIAGALYGPEAIPPSWLRRLEKPVREECEAQARALIRLTPAPL